MSEPSPPPALAPQQAAAPVARVRGTRKYAILLIVLLAGCPAGNHLYARSQNPLPPTVDELKAHRESEKRTAGAHELATDGDNDHKIDETLARLFDRN